jgi:hypothetical protein
MKKKYKYAKTMIPVGNTDLKLLYKQKAELVDIINNKTYCKGILFKKEEDALQGILHFLDYIQDEMVKAGIPEKVVFPNLGKE